MKIILAADEKTNLTDSIQEYLKEKGHEVTLLGDLSDESKKWHWAEISQEAAKIVANAENTQGIFLCWSGTGISIAANKIKGIRAALCWDAETARLARKWNNANVLCMSLRFTSETVAKEIMDMWFTTEFDEEGLNQVEKLD